MAVITPIDETGPALTKLRYPGLRSFEDTGLERDLFCGRSDDTRAVLHQILSRDLFVLFAGSGTGKTSLLKAGVMQELREREHWPVLVRLDDRTRPPHEAVREAVRTTTIGSDVDVLGIDREVDGLWEFVAGLEVWRGNVLQMPVLIFDQFEELFSFQTLAARSALINDVAKIVRRRPSQPLPRAAESVELPPPRVKIVLSIREDRLSELEAFAGQLPQILTHRYQLQPLTCEQAERAIRGPAEVVDERIESQRFAYSPEAVGLITGFLGEQPNTGSGEGIEPFQLQIICHHIETVIVPQKRSGLDANEDGVPAKGSKPGDGETADGESSNDVVLVEPTDLDDGKDLSRILRDFYTRQVESFPSRRDRRRIRSLCETKLISSTGRRKLVAKEEIEDSYGVGAAQLTQLENRRLLRAEPRRDTRYYELTHDTLVKPVLEARQERLERRRRRNRILALVGIGTTAIVFAVLLFTGVLDDDEPAVHVIGGAPWSGAIDDGEDQAEINFSGVAGKAASFTLTAEAGTTLELTSANGGGVIAAATAAEPDEPVGLSQVLPETGTFRLVVSGAPGVDFEVQSRPIETDCETTKGACAMVLEIDDDGGPLYGVFESNKIDRFVLRGTEGQLITLTLSPSSQDVDGVLRAFATSDGSATTQLGSRQGGDEGEPDVISLQLPADGSYSVTARGAIDLVSAAQDAGGYTVRAELTELIEEDQSEWEGTTTGEWTALGFIGSQDELVALTIDMEPADGEVRVLDSAGEEIGARQGPRTVVAPDASGEYRIWLRTPVPGPYTLAIDRDVVADAGGATTEVFAFEGTVGELVDVSFDAAGEAVVAQLIGPDSEVVHVAELDSSVQLMTVVLPASGQYLLLSKSTRQLGEGDAVTLTRRGEAGLVSIVYAGEPIQAEGRIGSGGAVDVYRLNGEAGEAMKLTLSSDALDGVLAVYSTSGSELGFSDFGGGPGKTEHVSTVLPADGAALILVSGDAGSTGTYGLELDRAEVVVLDDKPDRVAEGGLRRTEDDVYAFTAAVGEPLALSLETVELDGVLEIYGPNGDPIATIDGRGPGGSETATVVPTADGVHWVVVRGVGSSAGGYRLTLQSIEVRELGDG